MDKTIALPVVGFIGLSHLGLVTSTVLSSFGVRTICFDFDSSLIEELDGGVSRVSEPGLLELLRSNKQKQIFTSCIGDLDACDLVYISCDVPTNSEGKSDVSLIEEIIQLIQEALPKKTIVILSQIYPGFTRAFAELTSDAIYCQVETLVFGNAIERALKQTRIVVGSKYTGDPLPKAFNQILRLYKCPIFVFSYETAELTKVAINSFLASDIALTNTLAEISGKIGAEWRNVVEALILDKRIGTHRYLQPGLGIAGGNIERDLQTLIDMSLHLKTNDSLLKAIVDVNQYHRSWTVRKLREYGLLDLSQRSFGILGLTYKAGTNSLKNSPAISVIEQLPKSSVISVYDPVIKSIELNTEIAFSFKSSPLEVIHESDIILIMTPWQEFDLISRLLDSSTTKEKIFIDPFGILKKESKKLDMRLYVTIGLTTIT